MIKPPQDPKKDSHCTWCGAEFTEQVAWPRVCFICNNESYKNPIPVVVGLIPVFQRGMAAQCGWLVEQRNIDPKKGEWALPGGFVDFGEDWRTALVRELIEEVGLVAEPEALRLLDVLHAPTTGNMLIFASHPGVFQDEIKFEPNREVSAIKFPILPEHQELCFPTHNEVWRKHYDSQG